MERKGFKKRILSLLLVLSMVVATWIGAVPSQTVMAAAKPALNKTSVDVLVGKSVKLKLKKKIAKAKVNWKSKNKKIAKVNNKNGKVAGVKQGNTRVTANVTVKGKKYSLNCKVRVVKKAGALRITYDDGKTAAPLQLKVGENVSLEAEVTAPKNSNDFVKSWKSSNDDAVTVSKTGELSAVKAGDATITATTFGKAKATIAVKVVEGNAATPSASTNPTVNPPSTTPSQPTTTPGQTVQPTTSPGQTIQPTSSPEQTTSPTGTPEATQTPPTSGEPLFTSSFENGNEGFGGRSATATNVDTEAYDGDHSIYVTGRTAAWNGTQINATSFMEMGNRYFVRGYVRQDTGSDQTMKISLEFSYGGGSSTYPAVVEQVVESGVWTLMEGYVDIDAAPPTINMYFEMPSSATDNFYVDMVSVWWNSEVVIEPPDADPPEGILKEAYEGLFTMGTAVTSRQLTDAGESDKLDHVVEQYDSVTMENEMKPEAILRNSPVFEGESYDRSYLPEGYTDEKVPQLNFATVDACLAVAQEKGLKMRGHTLVWHSQTPAWFFREDYSASGALVTKEVMNARMEFYIKSVLEHVQTNYPGVIYSWDVCNEVFTNNGAADYENALRGGNPSAGESSNWYSVYQSDEFIINAFTYANKYVEDGVSLLYNDYNEYMTDKTDNIVTLANKLYDIGMETNGESLIDGIGMQSHIDLRYPSVGEVKTAIEKFAAVGDGSLEIQLTELDVTINFGGATGFTMEQQTEYYADLMKMLVDLRRDDDVNITVVTFWGFYDEMSWRGGNTPLLLNYHPIYGFLQKGAWMSVMNAPTVQ